MTLLIQISGKPNEINVCMRQQYTGATEYDPESHNLHKTLCDLLEPAVYETVRGVVERGVIQQATVHWDGQTIRLKK